MTLPDQIGRYRVISLLGAGGMGQVFLAEDTSLGRRVALKILSPETGVDSDRPRRLVQEARLASALNHPNIAHIFEIGESEGVGFIAMEYVEGEPLSRRIQNGPLGAAEAIDVAIQVFDALDEAHRQNIIHRDLKPANILLNTRGLVKILDFGLATKIDDATAAADETRLHTDPGLILGTVHYMSPEQALGQALDVRTDIFSAGIVLYELLTGRLPFSGVTVTETLDKIVHGQPESISRLNYGTPPELERIVRKALEKEPVRRYQTARDVLIDLNNLKRDSDSSVSRRQPTSSKRTRKAIDSIAVLPLATATSDVQTDYLADGLTESLISALSQLPKLKVMARSTVFRYKGRELDPQAVGRELGVRAVLMGRLQRVGDGLVIRIELVDAFDGSHIWGAQFQRRSVDAFTLPDDAAAEIAEQLRLRLTSAERKKLAKRHTENPQAFEAYLKGRYQLAKRTMDGFNKAVTFFEQAIAEDPRYALAFAGLADCWTLMSAGAYGEPSTRTMARARDAAEQAIALDDSLAEAHTALGFVRFRIDWDWTSAKRALIRACELNPGHAPAHHRLALLLSALGRHDEALAEIRRAHELDPLSLIISTAVGRILHFGRRYEEAIQQCRRTLEMDVHFVQAHFDLGMAYAQAGRYDEAIAEFEANLAIDDPRSVMLAVLAWIYARAGQSAKAEAYLVELQRRYARGEAASYDLGLAFSGLGRTADALDWLERACEARSGLLVFLRVEPMFDQLRDSLRFHGLLQRLGLGDPSSGDGRVAG